MSDVTQFFDTKYSAVTVKRRSDRNLFIPAACTASLVIHGSVLNTVLNTPIEHGVKHTGK